MYGTIHITAYTSLCVSHTNQQQNIIWREWTVDWHNSLDTRTGFITFTYSFFRFSSFFFHSLLPFSIFNYCECNQNAKLKEFMSVLNVLLVYIFQLGGESKSERWLCSVLRRSLHEILYVIVCREHKNVHNKSDFFLILSFNSFCSASFCWSPQYARYHGHLFVDNLQDRLKWIRNTHTTEKVQDFYIRKPFHQANSPLNLQAKQ